MHTCGRAPTPTSVNLVGGVVYDCTIKSQYRVYFKHIHGVVISG